MLEFKKISRIKKVKQIQKVYNFDVPEFESYIANGFIVHNCQNWKISQVDNSDASESISPQSLVDIALSNKCGAICFTYNEPIIYYEYVMDVAEICKSKNIDFIIKTNGFAEKSIWKDMCRVSSAVNIDWKGNETKYREIAKAFGVPVLESIEYAVENTHLEISVPVYHDDKIEDHIEFSSFMKRFINVPIHLLKLYPAYKQLVNITSDALVKNIKNVYSSSRYVYVQNIFEEGLQDSFCPVCYKLVASRKSLYTELHYDSCCNLSIIKL